MAKRDFVLGELNVASASARSNPNSGLMLWDPEAEDSFLLLLSDLFANTGVERAVRSVSYSTFKREYNTGQLQFGRNTLVYPPSGGNQILVTEVGPKNIHPIAVELKVADGVTTPTVVTWNIVDNVTSELALAGSNGSFNGNRPVKSTPQVGVTYGGTTLLQWVENAYFGFLPAQLIFGLNADKFEYGTDFTVVASATIVPRDETAITFREIRKGTTLLASSAANEFSTSDPISSETTYRLQVRVGNQGNPTTLQTSITIKPVLPIYIGVGTFAQATNRAFIQASQQKTLSKNAEHTFTVTANQQRIYISVPVSFGFIKAIVDEDNSDILGGFTRRPAEDFLFGEEEEEIPYYTLVLNSDYTATNSSFTFKF